MRTIYKYDITTDRRIFVPRGSRVLSVGIQADRLTVWIECSPNKSEWYLDVFVIGTGHTIPAEAVNYVGTVQNGPFVWHIYTGAMPL